MSKDLPSHNHEYYKFDPNHETKYYQQHGLSYNILIYSCIISTAFLFSYSKGPRFYKRILTRILNANLLGSSNLKILHLFGISTLLCTLFLFFLKMQVQIFTDIKPTLETSEKRIFRLKHKWLIEAQMWLVSLLIVDLLYNIFNNI